jgi:predicted component of type VI protein secretion system
MNVRLVIEKGPTKVQKIRLHSQETIVGRQKGCDLRIPSKTVSRRHCLLSFRDGFLTAEDLDSANGTFLNGERLNGKEVVRPGDRLEIGPLVFAVEYQLTQDAIDRLLRGGAEDFEEVECLEEVSEEGTEEVECPPELDADEEPVHSEMIPVDREAEAMDVGAEPGAESILVLDDETEPWQLPDDGELRNILSHLDGK